MLYCYQLIRDIVRVERRKGGLSELEGYNNLYVRPLFSTFYYIMSQPSVAAYFNTRKRQACDELRGKSKVLLLERDHSSNEALTHADDSEQIAPNEKGEKTKPLIVLKDAPVKGTRVNKAVRNIQFDSSKTSLEKTPNRPRIRAMRSHALSATDGSQPDIRDSLLKTSSDSGTKKVPFAKMGMLSPKKKPQTPTKSSTVPKDSVINEKNVEEQSANSCPLTPLLSKKAEKLANHKQLLEQPQKQNNVKKPQMQKFEKIELEIPIR